MPITGFTMAVQQIIEAPERWRILQEDIRRSVFKCCHEAKFQAFLATSAIRVTRQRTERIPKARTSLNNPIKLSDSGQNAWLANPDAIRLFATPHG